MSAISTTGARIDRWDNGRPAHREQARLIEAVKLERSSRYLCSEGFITFISKPHDDDAALILAPYSPICPSIHKPPAANRDPVAGDDQKPSLLRIPVGPLALPSGKGRRIAVEIGNKLNVVTKMTKHMLQLVRARASDLPAIVPMLLNYSDHLIHIGTDEGTQCNGAAIQTLPRVAAPYCP
jgi:hypothetical protein